ncbi:MAG: glutamate--cysteine ligase [Zetaproteobacteria bacterium CG_4_9_14_3_um_filter_49_83]|nr:MAG: glutamate--cysteine ligase [Zetaproteobacteria bacterium CG1_02_49_23]PIQ33390.1 MAG: glutamate--cysteine ligase [Zetaproteobacteria bacterium CG17_big_fil_post_rev_8_21_14_2_50_50_13]PIV31621.1 MAG: glutamate--cysteine ligase [Zetaproteobacteria bacterium CG02_land_8_20_14_3_00_50_9]PIY55753.1 MAG: glutamate--cysteine ligase [Zetaproteobacteria bacterium CG_4_10_14_0_8_um_filter_49_80]PJA35087.1 MAG: glutamate--cysteine ligase [Zetaproteobacteria bacterium CG_4_9_14_3_um_filter_49_83]
MNTPLTKESMIHHFARGCKPRSEWKVGTEHEKIGFCVDTLRPIPYDGKRSIRRLLEIRSKQGWEHITEDGNLIALRSGLASITLEPGGQLELSGAPLASIHETCFETTQHLRLLKEITDKLGIGFLAMGFQPKWQREDIPWMPKARYAVMRQYMPKVGGKGLDMMLRTATVQSNLDFESEADMARKMRISICLQPLVTALYAASPFVEGKPTGLLSNRAAVWLDTDPNRTGIPACVFEPDFGFESWVDWLLDVPMYFVIRDGRYVDCTGESFRDFLAGKLPQLPGELPTGDDWDLHSSTVFPDVRLKQYLEMRGADAGSWSWICGLSALWKGLLYDPATEDRVWAMIADWQYEEVEALRQRVPETAMATPFRDTRVLELCAQMLELAYAGLDSLDIRDCQGENETKFLKPMMQAVESGQTQAEQWLHAYHHEWEGRIEPVFIHAMHQ